MNGKNKSNNNMREDYIEFKTAKLAKEKGFEQTGDRLYGINTRDNKPHYWTNHRYTPTKDEYVAPTQTLLQKWLRTKEIFVYVIPEDHGSFRYEFFDEGASYFPEPSDHVYFDTWEEALEDGLQKALKLIKV